jgi:hypothetical protein
MTDNTRRPAISTMTDRELYETMKEYLEAQDERLTDMIDDERKNQPPDNKYIESLEEEFNCVNIMLEEIDARLAGTADHQSNDLRS